LRNICKLQGIRHKEYRGAGQRRCQPGRRVKLHDGGCDVERKSNLLVYRPFGCSGF
jgi:hypothetical protein